MANPAIEHLKQHVIEAQGTAFNVDRPQRRISIGIAERLSGIESITDGLFWFITTRRTPAPGNGGDATNPALMTSRRPSVAWLSSRFESLTDM